MLHGISGRRPIDEMVLVDLYKAGFRADGTTYEGAEKGYIGKRGTRGYKASFAYVHRCREVLGCVFDNGKASEIKHTDQMPDIVKSRICSPRVRAIVIRGDAAYGNASVVNRLVEQGYRHLSPQRNALIICKKIREADQGMDPDKEERRGYLCWRDQSQDKRLKTQDMHSCLQGHQEEW
jgi:hypothetical protein